METGVEGGGKWKKKKIGRRSKEEELGKIRMKGR